jgi:hypothetical protein
MVKASVALSNGTVVNIEGSKEEVQELLAFYSGDTVVGSGTGASPMKTAETKGRSKGKQSDGRLDLAKIVNFIKNCDDAEAIETTILDKISLVNRTLLSLYIVHEYMGNAFKLSSGEISKVTTDLGVPISTANASRTLSKTAAKYVIGDKVRKQGSAVRYKLSRRGLTYLKSIISEK